MTTEELDKFFYDSLKATYSKASDMELNDLRIPGESLAVSGAIISVVLTSCRISFSANVLQSTSAFTEPRELASLPAFVNSRECNPSVRQALNGCTMSDDNPIRPRRNTLPA
jgi:hypothetical protein